MEDLEVLSSTKNIYPHLKVGLFMQDFGTSVLSLPRVPPTPKHFCRKFVPLGDLEGVEGHLRAEIFVHTSDCFPKVGTNSAAIWHYNFQLDRILCATQPVKLSTHVKVLDCDKYFEKRCYAGL